VRILQERSEPACAVREAALQRHCDADATQAVDPRQLVPPQEVQLAAQVLRVWDVYCMLSVTRPDENVLTHLDSCNGSFVLADTAFGRETVPLTVSVLPSDRAVLCCLEAAC